MLSDEITMRCRHELKFTISEAQAAAMAEHVRSAVPLDPHANRGAYPVVTLYLDSPDLRLCRESLEGVKNRFKLRVRSYTDAPDSPYSFEIKRRMNRVIAKSRAWVCKEDMPAALNGSIVLSRSDHNYSESLTQFRYYQARLRAAPVLRVRYLRQAFETAWGNHLRVTFDRQLHFVATPTPNVQMNGRGWQPFPGNPVVLEIKFNGRFPGWLGRIIHSFGIQDRSFSKYALSVRHACGRRFSAPRCPRRAGNE